MRLVQLDASARPEKIKAFDAALRSKVIGQEGAVSAIVDCLQLFVAKLNRARSTIGNFLFLGPTGTGKTHVVESAAEILFGHPSDVIKVDCAEFQHSHEIAKLIGSPPGYLGHRETPPLITQDLLAKHHKDDWKLSFLLFDEVEKAHESLWQLLLGILDKAILTLGTNQRVDLSQTMIFMTSNVGSRQISEQVDGGLGFVNPTVEDEDLGNKVEAVALHATRRKFAPEFINRLDYQVVFRYLDSEQLNQILDLELGLVARRLSNACSGLQLRVNDSACALLLAEGTNRAQGARPLRRTIEKRVTRPIANMISTEQFRPGDVAHVGCENGELSFFREENDALCVAGMV